MSTKRRILVALSGGVDSSVAAALLAREGHELVGVTLKLAPDGSSGQCCGLDGVARARQICDRLDIPFQVMDTSDFFRKTVIDPFLEEYSKGRTPNPCVSCNRHVKFEHLFEVAKRLGFTDVATGHYARIENSELRRGRDLNKDQSYALYMLTHERLSRLHFPLGGFTKPETRAIAKDLGFATASTPESMDICFVGPSHVAYIEKERPGIGHHGDMVDTKGKVLGQHEGLHRYTPGQRQGLGLGGQKGREGAWFVLGINPEKNQLIVGGIEELGQTAIEISGISSTLEGGTAAIGEEVLLQVRYGKGTVPARLQALPDGGIRAIPESPVVTAPGQAAVFYHQDNDKVLGGGTVERVINLVPTFQTSLSELP